MKLNEVVFLQPPPEIELGQIPELGLLMKHGDLDYDRAVELFHRLKQTNFMVNRRLVPANLSWEEDRETGALRFVASKMPGSWRSGPAAVSRYQLTKMLKDYGFKTATMGYYAAKRQEHIHNGPHIYFWGPGTPPPKPMNEELDSGNDHPFIINVIQHLLDTGAVVRMTGKFAAHENIDMVRSLAASTSFATAT